MLYIKRNTQGEIVMLSKEPSPECNETVAAHSSEVYDFLAQRTGQSPQMIASDLAFVRVVEDILEVLLNKGIITFTDLPEAAQAKVMERKSLRVKNNVDLLGGDSETI